MSVASRPETGPDAEAITAFAEMVFGYTEGLVPIRILSEKGTASAWPETRFERADERLHRALQEAACAAHERRRGLFVVPGTVMRPGKAAAADIVQIATLLVDLDTGDIDTQREHLVHYLGPPTHEVTEQSKPPGEGCSRQGEIRP